MIARFAVLALMVLGFGAAEAAPSPVPEFLLIADEGTPGVGPTECNGGLQAGPSLDDPNVDTDPERPIMEHASVVMDDSDDQGDGDQGDQSDNGAEGQCRSETLELWHHHDFDAIVQAMVETYRAHS